MDVNIRDGLGRTPLLQAASVSDTDVIALLIAHGADVNAKTPRGETAYTIALHRHDNTSDDIVALLVKAGEKDAHPILKTPDVFLQAQSDEAQAVHALLAGLSKNQGFTVFVRDSASTKDNNHLDVGTKIPGIPSEMLVAFRDSIKRSEVYPDFTDLKSVRCVRESDIFKNGEMWDNFYKQYPHGSSLCIMSLPVFDKDHRYALIYAEFESGGWSGVGNLYLLHRGSRGWKVVKEKPVWIS